MAERPALSRRQVLDALLDGDELLSTGTVAAAFNVKPATAGRWATSGRIPDTTDGRPGVIRTPAGRRGDFRWRASVVYALLNGEVAMKEVADVADDDQGARG